MNESGSLPPETRQNEDTRNQIVVNSVLLYIGVFGNLVILVYLLKTWKTANRVYFFVLCLCIADILGVGVRLGIDIGWLTTVGWSAGDVACKICMFLYMFGTTLAHYFLASFNVDNVITVCSYTSYKIARILLLLVSITATVCICAPEAFAYNVHHHPADPEFTQCARFGFFEDSNSETIYFYVKQAGIYWFPLLVILLSGVPAAITWCRRHGTFEYEEAKKKNGEDLKTLGTDLVLVTAYDIVFFLCWTPLVVTTIYHLTSYRYSIRINMLVLYIYRATDYIAIANSSLNPIIYGVFACLQRRRGGDNTSGL